MLKPDEAFRSNAKSSTNLKAYVFNAIGDARSGISGGICTNNNYSSIWYIYSFN